MNDVSDALNTCQLTLQRLSDAIQKKMWHEAIHAQKNFLTASQGLFDHDMQWLNDRQIEILEAMLSEYTNQIELLTEEYTEVEQSMLRLSQGKNITSSYLHT